MTYLPAELIRKKRAGRAHTQPELKFLIQQYSQGHLPDYQMAAWLMAVCFQGMTEEEVAWLTQEMRDSGTVLDLEALGTTVDKHSTGGLGDKTSLILAPLVAATGLKVPMMAGRGLAHTGGTLDKLESLKGFNVRLDLHSFRAQLAEVGAAIIGQTEEICPADRKLYALRDVTGTVDSLPLICGSIMSKKLAEGMTALVLDVKWGTRAFMKTLPETERLARALCDIGQRSGKAVTALITRMDEPLGRTVGNSLEMQEAIDILHGRTRPESYESGKDYSETIDLTVQLAAHMLVLGKKAATLAEGESMARHHLQDGSALKKFAQICERQGCHWPSPLPQARETAWVLAEKSGYFAFTDLESLGHACIHLGAGRRFQSDSLDLAAGLEVLLTNGTAVKAGDRLFRVHHNRPASWDEALAKIKQSYAISSEPKPRSPLVAKVLT